MKAILASTRFVHSGFAVMVQSRGYAPKYKNGEVNSCPGCGRSHWHIGRMMAECGFCATAIPLEKPVGMAGVGLFRCSGNKPKVEDAA